MRIIPRAIHVSTCLVVAIAVALLWQLNREPRLYAFGLPPGAIDETERGWPLTYSQTIRGDAVLNSPPDSFSFFALAVDGVLALLAAIAIGASFDWWRRRHTSWRQVQLLDVLLAVLLLSSLLGVWRHRYDRAACESLAAARVQKAGLGLLWERDWPAWLWRFLPGPTASGYRHPIMAGNSFKTDWSSSDAIVDLDDSALGDLAQLVSLERIEIPFQENGGPFARVRITDQGLARLARLRRLKELNVAHQPITDAGLDSLSALAELRYLDVRGTNVTVAGVDRLRTANPRLLIDWP